MSVDVSPDNGNAKPERLLMGERESCELLSVSAPTFRRWVAHGLLAPVKLPDGTRRRLYRRSDLESFAAHLRLVERS